MQEACEVFTESSKMLEFRDADRQSDVPLNAYIWFRFLIWMLVFHYIDRQSDVPSNIQKTRLHEQRIQCTFDDVARKDRSRFVHVLGDLGVEKKSTM